MDWSERYSTPLTAVFSRAHKLALEHRVEVALLHALEAEGVAPAGAGDEAAAAAAAGVAGGALLARTLAIEKETHHDIMAMGKALAEAMPTAGARRAQRSADTRPPPPRARARACAPVRRERDHCSPRLCPSSVQAAGCTTARRARISTIRSRRCRCDARGSGGVRCARRRGARAALALAVPLPPLFLCLQTAQLSECTTVLLASTRAVRAELTRLAVTHRSECLRAPPWHRRDTAATPPDAHQCAATLPFQPLADHPPARPQMW